MVGQTCYRLQLVDHGITFWVHLACARFGEGADGVYFFVQEQITLSEYSTA